MQRSHVIPLLCTIAGAGVIGAVALTGCGAAVDTPSSTGPVEHTSHESAALSTMTAVADLSPHATLLWYGNRGDANGQKYCLHATACTDGAQVDVEPCTDQDSVHTVWDATPLTISPTNSSTDRATRRATYHPRGCPVNSALSIRRTSTPTGFAWKIVVATVITPGIDATVWDFTEGVLHNIDNTVNSNWCITSAATSPSTSRVFPATCDWTAHQLAVPAGGLVALRAVSKADNCLNGSNTPGCTLADGYISANEKNGASWDQNNGVPIAYAATTTPDATGLQPPQSDFELYYADTASVPGDSFLVMLEKYGSTTVQMWRPNSGVFEVPPGAGTLRPDGTIVLGHSNAWFAQVDTTWGWSLAAQPPIAGLSYAPKQLVYLVSDVPFNGNCALAAPGPYPLPSTTLVATDIADGVGMNVTPCSNPTLLPGKSNIAVLISQL